MDGSRKPKIIYGGRPICNNENPRRCRKTAKWWMDGVLFCDEHIGTVSPSFSAFVYPIRWVKDGEWTEAELREAWGK